ncbi:50S ribosomal protein L11 methyltransferase [Pseudothermotoga thermarum]|uniref:Methyltransferase small n=1 Tax=Pseudothermotoga thermarum DSM 5069 TaxID=688269 RepID=F7YYH7_9THEM|nr:50S ribosomal protein L11 methyltransferase [Pseudothermotoga thermarum]AEH51004.1 methyltransferase small [Pseudothermotoga thermarum DSM 5069]
MNKVHEWIIEVDDFQPLEQYFESIGFWNYAVEKTAYSLFIKIYTEDESFVESLLKRSNAKLIEHRVLEPKDWFVYLELKPFQIAPGVIVDPTGKLKGIKGATVVKMWPSAAFGTGDHPTTKLAAQLMVENIEKIRSLLDVGCGTGILAIIAKKLGVEKVVAVDNDSTALQVAEEFCKLNKVKINLVLSDLLSSVEDKFDMVVANINTLLCVKLLEQIDKVSHKDTLVVLSGIPNDEMELVLDFALSKNFEIISVRGMEGWKATLLKI